MSKNENTTKLKDEKVKTPHISPHNNPNQYNGELIVNQDIKPNNTNKKKLFIESYVCN